MPTAFARRLVRPVFAAVVALPFLLPGTVRAGEIAEAGVEAERLIQAGRNREAAELLLKAADAAAATAPLEFRVLTLVAAEPQGFGVYVPRDGNVYRAGETIMVYGEPFGFGYGQEGEVVKIDFDVRLSVVAPDGKEEIAPRTGRLSLQSRHRNREFMLSFQYEPRGLAAGEHVLVAQFRDLASGKTTTQRLPFRIQ